MTDIDVISKQMTTARSKQALRRSIGSWGAMAASSSTADTNNGDHHELRSATSSRVTSASKNRRASLDHSILSHPTNFSSPLSARKPNSSRQQQQSSASINGFHHAKDDLPLRPNSSNNNNHHNRPKTTGTSFKAKKSQQSMSNYDDQSSEIVTASSGSSSVQIFVGDSPEDNEDEEGSTVDNYPSYLRATSSLDIIDREMQAIRDRTLTRCRRDPPRGSQQFENLMHEFQKKLDVDSGDTAERESFDRVDDTLMPPHQANNRRRRLSWNPEVSVLQISRISESELD